MLSGSDRLPVPGADVHAHQDVAFLDGGLGGGAARQDGLDVESAAKLGRDRRHVFGRDRLGLQPQQPPDHLIGRWRCVGHRVDVEGHGPLGAARRIVTFAGWPGRTSSIPRSTSRALAIASSPTRTSSSPGLKPGGFRRAPGLHLARPQRRASYPGAARSRPSHARWTPAGACSASRPRLA